VIRALDVDKVKEIIELNKKGIFPEKVFDENSKVSPKISLSFKEELNSDSLTRFDTPQKPKQKNRRNKNRHNKFRKPNEKKN
jgi:queuine/archaeosine tRNA-ribosyltransferase